MQEEKISLWKKYEFVIIAVMTLAFIYALVFFSQKLDFLLGNELIVYLTPQQKSLSMHYNEVSEINFDISIDNVAYCKASCSYSFNDRSRNNMIDKGFVEIGKNQHVIKSYNLSIKRLGSGQDIYSFDTSCHSIRTYLCLTKSSEKSRSSLVIVNYDLTETEKKLKELLKQNVTNLLEELRNIDLMHQKVNQKYFELGFKINLQNLTSQKINIDDVYDKTRIKIENFRGLWSVENYLKLNELFNESFFMNLSQIRQSLMSLNESIDVLVKLHNTLLSELRDIADKSIEINEFVNIIGDDKIQNNFSINVANLYWAASPLINNTFKDYDSIGKEIAEAKKEQNSIIESAKAQSEKIFFDLTYNLNFEKDFLCSLNQGCETNGTVLNLFKNAEQLNRDYPDSSLLNQVCRSFNDLNDSYARARSEALLPAENHSFPDDNGFKALADSFKENNFRELNNSYYSSFGKMKQENKTSKDVIEMIEYVLPSNITILTPLTYNSSLNLSLYLLSKLDLSEKAKELLEKCSAVDKKLIIINLSLEPVSTEVNFTVASRIETILSDNPPICCVFNDCKPCCRDESCKDDPRTFPIIFLHGHSFAKSNSPEFSLDSFDKLQTKLQDDGYLNAGIVSLYSKNEPLQQGIWGLSGKPVTVKVSYYYDAFKKEDKYIVVPTKSENIDTYVLRLKDLIEMVKQRTNKPKVNIVAHSMGGLVARRYLQIFGEADIDKLIMIAAPNNGIAYPVSNYCGIIGENRECQDMQQNSLFLNKLNDQSLQPKKVRLYTIIGQGCNMDSKDGDGVVLVDNAKFENSKLFYVNGTCGGIFGSVLHTEILNIEKYPETYQEVAEILRE